MIREYTGNLRERIELERKVLDLLKATAFRTRRSPVRKRVTYGPGMDTTDCSELQKTNQKT